MALYRYVRSKEELLLLMADAAFEEPSGGLGEGDWRATRERGRHTHQS